MEVEITVKDLLEILRANRDKHITTFEKAMEGYRKEWLEVLERHLDDIRAGKPIYQWTHIVEPKNQTKDYDRVIRMLELEVNETWEVGEVEFAQYVEDDWSWSHDFATSTSYLNSKFS